MKRLFAIALLLIVGQVSADQPQQIIDIQHDSVHGATCWILNDRAISCLPDSQLHQQTGVGAKIPASTPAPRRYQEGFQL